MNWIKEKIHNFALLGLLLGVLGVIFNLYQAFEQSGLSMDPTEVSVDDIERYRDNLGYITVTGSKPDFNNTLSYEIKRKKRSKSSKTTWFTPMLDSRGKLAFIAITDNQPTATYMSSITGLVKTDDLNDKVIEAYVTAFGDQSFISVNDTEKPKSFMERAGNLGIFIALTIICFLARKFISKPQ